MDSLSKTEKFSLTSGWQQEWKDAGCDEAERHTEEQGLVVGCPRYGSRAGNPAVAAAIPGLHCAGGAHGHHKALPLVHNHLTEESHLHCKHPVTAALSPCTSCPSPGGERQPSSLLLQALVCLHRMHPLWPVPGTSAGSGPQENPLTPKPQGSQGRGLPSRAWKSSLWKMCETFPMEAFSSCSSGDCKVLWYLVRISTARSVSAGMTQE